MATITEYVEFNGVKTSDYNVIASGGDAFNAPARVYEMIDIPGRDGQFALDMGRFENIDVPYHCTNHEPNDMATFRANLDGLRNAFLSARGYQRLEDTFHPDEYRMAVYKSGLEAKMIGQAYASEFDLVFNCKPQRFLKSGETAVSVASGGTITNPTAFESKPLIEFGGYGTMTVNGYPITITAGTLGEITLANASTGPYSSSGTTYFNQTLLNTGDTITLKSSSCFIDLKTTKNISSITTTATTGNVPVTIEYNAVGTNRYAVSYITSDFDFVKGTNTLETTNVTSKITYSDSSEETFTNEIKLVYNANYNYISFRNNFIGPTSTSEFTYYSTDMGKIIGVSTQSVLGNPIYVDCELGDCYKIENGEMVFLNSYVSMPNDLPVLSAGSNSVTYDNTITDFKITPHWWRI